MPPITANAGVHFGVLFTESERGQKLNTLPALPTGTVNDLAAGPISLCSTLERAQAWAIYLGRRHDRDRVSIWQVLPTVPVTAAARDLPPLPDLTTAGPVILEQLMGELNVWDGVPERTRTELVAVPF